jgi:ribosomal protein S18 acetylase RimI-like enzyme
MKCKCRGLKVEKVKIAFVDELSFDIELQMEKGLEEYEKIHAVDVNYKPFSLVLYDEKNDVIGAMAAFSSYSSVHIRDLWVDKAHRGKGHGKKMLEELEKHFTGKGLHNINTISCEFQAPDFYKKCGYEVEFVRENTQNPKLTQTFFIKYLN